MPDTMTTGDDAPGASRLLEGKVAIITGASQGIGATAARVFAAAGAIVVLAARNEQKLAAVAQQIVAAGGQALAVPTDVGDPAAVEHLVQQTMEAYGRLDAAFNNAAGGGSMPAPLADIAIADFDSAYRVNLRGVFLCLKYEIPAMLAGGGGAIVNMSSTAGLRSVPGLAAYAATKHGIIGLTKTAALDYATQNIRVNVVTPGPILNDRMAALPEGRLTPVIRTVPMQRVGRPAEVGAVVVWLCSDQASFITGATIPIDGGKLAAGA